MACYSSIEEVFKNPLNSGMDSERNFGLNDKTGRLAPEAVMVVAGENFASFWSVLINCCKCFPTCFLATFRHKLDFYMLRSLS